MAPCRRPGARVPSPSNRKLSAAKCMGKTTERCMRVERKQIIHTVFQQLVGRADRVHLSCRPAPEPLLVRHAACWWLFRTGLRLPSLHTRVEPILQPCWFACLLCLTRTEQVYQPFPPPHRLESHHVVPLPDLLSIHHVRYQVSTE